MSKSYVTIEQKVCPVTGKTWDTGSILIHKHLRDTFERNTVTGWEICPEVQEKLDEGYVALVAIDEDRSEKGDNGTVTPQAAYRLGQVAYVKRDLCTKLFGRAIDHPFIWVDQEMIDHLKQIQ